MKSYGELKPIIDQAIQNKVFQMYSHPKKLGATDSIQTSSKIYWEALSYASLGEGKRIRPSLVYYFATGSGCSDFPNKNLENFICAIEWVHTYSLVHDDLPCMDNDDFRRGKPTVHKRYNEALAMLAGDALLTDAFALIANSDFSQESASKHLLAIQSLSLAAGSKSMILGQAIDLANTGSTLNSSESGPHFWKEEHLNLVHTLKTGKLMGASCVLGVCLGNQDLARTNEISHKAQRFGEKLGLVFQMIDDILDGSPETGKTKGKDKASGKVTFLDLFGETKTKKAAFEMTQTALSEIESSFENKISYQHLNKLVNELVYRNF